MEGSEFVRLLPPHAGPSRESAILGAARANLLAPMTWVPLLTTKNGRTLQVFVTSDALKVGTERDAVRLDSKVQGRPGLAETVGKNWVLSNVLLKHRGRAANYGWYDDRAPYRSAPGGRGAHRVWQPLGVAHDLAHVDYSQIIRLVHRTCVLDGEPCALAQVLTDSMLAPLVSDEGVMRLTRVPGVPLLEPIPLAS